MRIFIFCLVVFSFSCSRKINLDSNASMLSSDKIQAILIDQGGLIGPCEPSIAINPTNPQNIVAGSVLDRVYFSNDGGYTWTKDKLKSSFGVYGDPVVRADGEGRFYYAHLSNPTGRAYRDTEFLDRIVIQKSMDNGKSWSNGSYTLPRSPKDQDKQWLAIDPQDQSLYITWTEFDLYGSKDPKHKSRILFSKSNDFGESWTDPVTLSELEGDCEDDDQTTEGAVPSVGVNGEIFVAWSFNEKIYFDKSVDGGKTWLKHDVVVAEQPGGWTYDIPGVLRCNGMPITSVDRSNGPNRGTIYVNWSDQRNGEDNTDIWLSSSKDSGISWSTPVKVNNDTSDRHQFFTWMDIDQSTGYIYMVFYDRRNHSDNSTDVYLACSKDGGKSFENIKINKQSFVPNPLVFFGDYNDISVYNGRVRPIWTEFDGVKLSIWTAIIN